jgi:thiol:disulfide interchange protein DsbG
MKKFAVICLTAAMGLALSACSPQDSIASPSTPSATTKVAIPEKQAISIEALVKDSKGFTVGATMSARTTYVFFDAQCTHCGNLWEAAKPLQSQMKFVWIPVGVLNKASVTQGATILGASDPVAAMNEHEKSLTARTGGISASSSVDPAMTAALNTNTRVMTSFSIESVPYIVTTGKAGKLVTSAGAASTQALATLLELNYTPETAPAASAQ